MISVYDLLYYRTQYEPQDTALIFNDVQITYGQLGKKVANLAYGLRKIGVKKGTFVGYLFSNNPCCVELFYALQKIGAVAIPFNFRYRAKEIQPLIELVNCRYFFYGEAYKSIINEVKQQVDPEIIYVEVGNKVLNGSLNYQTLFEYGCEAADISCPANEDNLALMLFTGGTTGIPKAVMLTGEDIYLKATMHLLDVNDFKKDTVMLCYSPLFHVAGMTYLLYLMSLGATLILKDSFDIDDMLRTIEKNKITHIFMIPPGLCRRFKESQFFGKVDLSSIRFIIMSGGTNSIDIVREIFEMFPSALISNTYGHTESAADTILAFNRKEFEANTELCRSIGKQTKGSFIELRDEVGNKVGIDCPGEAWAKGPSMLAGFWGRKSPLVDGWYPTGDILKQDKNGYFFFMDRKKDMVKCGGENIFAVEVENVLNSHPAVHECAVFGLPNDKWSEIVAAAVVLKEGYETSENELIQYCKQNMASYKKPKKVFFVDYLPKSTIGKLQKCVLRDRFSQHEE